MQLDYVGYLIEPVCTFDDIDGNWNAAVILTKSTAIGSMQFDAVGGHATESNACNAALMHGQNLILSHLNGRSRILGDLDFSKSLGLEG